MIHDDATATTSVDKIASLKTLEREAAPAWQSRGLLRVSTVTASIPTSSEDHAKRRAIMRPSEKVVRAPRSTRRGK
jgi:hypothetical protein